MSDERDPEAAICECGHTRNYHVSDCTEDEQELGIGHFCEFEDCPCMDFSPAFVADRDAAFD